MLHKYKHIIIIIITIIIITFLFMIKNRNFIEDLNKAMESNKDEGEKNQCTCLEPTNFNSSTETGKTSLWM